MKVRVSVKYTCIFRNIKKKTLIFTISPVELQHSQLCAKESVVQPPAIAPPSRQCPLETHITASYAYSADMSQE